MTSGQIYWFMLYMDALGVSMFAIHDLGFSRRAYSVACAAEPAEAGALLRDLRMKKTSGIVAIVR
jgi:hypothetical protein